MFLRPVIKCSIHPGVIFTLRKAPPTGPQRPFPGRATGRGFRGRMRDVTKVGVPWISLCFLIGGRRTAAPLSAAAVGVEAVGARLVNLTRRPRGPRQGGPQSYQLQLVGGPRGTCSLSAERLASLSLFCWKIGQWKGPALRLYRFPQRAGSRTGNQTLTCSHRRGYFGPLTSARKVLETQPHTPSHSSGHASPFPPTPNSDLQRAMGRGVALDSYCLIQTPCQPCKTGDAIPILQMHKLGFLDECYLPKVTQ